MKLPLLKTTWSSLVDSKGAQKLKDEIAAKIEKTKEQLMRLKAELKVIKTVNEKPADKDAEQG